MLTVYHSPTHLFSSVHFSISVLSQLEQLSHLHQTLVPLQFPLPDVVYCNRCHTDSLDLLISGVLFAIIIWWILVRFYM